MHFEEFKDQFTCRSIRISAIHPILFQELKSLSNVFNPHHIIFAEYMSDQSRKNYFIKIAHLEGVSFILLLGIAMPLKYMAGIPEAVKYTGWAHGILFVWFMSVIATYSSDMKWPLTKRALAVFSGLFPFGTFWFTRKML